MIYHLSMKIHKRKDGASAVGKAAYRAAETITDERSGIAHDYQKKAGVAHKKIYTTPQAPEWVHDRSKLWNQVEAAEKRKDSQLCREIEISLVNELPLEVNIRLLDELLAPAIEDGALQFSIFMFSVTC